MTAPLSSAVVSEIAHQVYVRHASAGYLPVNGSAEGWVYEPRLRCDWVRQENGLRMGAAEFVVVPLDSTDDSIAFEKILADFSTDDQVRVVVQSIDDELVEPADVVLFEGRLVRPRVQMQANAAEEHEIVRFTAEPLPVLDNRRGQHQIYGRWIAHDATTADILDGYTLPAVFNFRGRPNMHATCSVTAGDGSFAFPVFTDDDDPAGLFWTVRTALLSLLGQWLVGGNLPYDPFSSIELARVTDIESDTLAALVDTSGDPRADRWVGLDARLPELTVQAMGVLDAVAAVCKAGGFDFAITPTSGSGLASGGRPYTLSIWRRNSGEIVYPRLAARGSTYASAEDALAENDVNRVQIMRDAAHIRNEVYAVGRTVVEVKMPLFPLWSPDDVDDATIDAALQTATTTNLAGTGYHAKHVAGGVLFGQYSHVGRRWGVAHKTFSGYPSAPYAQPTGGCDWVATLGLDDETCELRTAREAVGITKPITWSSRLRRALPLRHPTALERSVQYVVEVSEDGGSTWEPLLSGVTILADFFGITIDNVPNLATVNSEYFKTGKVSAIGDSWWALIDSEDLCFRLTAAVEADHGVRHDAFRQATSGSIYQLGEVMLTRDEERWMSSNHYFAAADAPAWQRIAGYEHDDPDTTTASIRAAAQRRQDAQEDVTLSATLGTWVVQFDRYVIGQQVGGIHGRNYSFAVSAGGGAVRFPNIVGITYRLAPSGQAMELSLDDHRLAAGR